MENWQARVGEYHLENGHKAGVKTRPALDIEGHPYDRVQGTVQLTPAHFAIIPSGFRNYALVDELRALVTPPKTTRKATDGN